MTRPAPAESGTVATVTADNLESSIARSAQALCALQRQDGHFVFELEADVTISSEYILMQHYRGEPVDTGLEAKVARYIRRNQSADGGWPLFYEGASDVSASVKAYFALKMIGDSPNAPHMVRARTWILSKGGAANSNVFTRNLLALYGAVPWRAVPVMPVEIMLLPRWFPFHLDKVSYWARTVLVPLMVLNAVKPRAKNAKGIAIDELFLVPPDRVRDWAKGAHQSWPWLQIFGGIDHVLRGIEPYMPKAARARAINRAERFVIERLNGEDGLGAIFPAMVNSLLMFEALGYGKDHPRVRTVRGAIERLLIVKEDEAYCQPCLSPIWDTALTAHTLLEVSEANCEKCALVSLEWLLPFQVLNTVGDWAVRRPNVRPGGWAFQYANPHYPDLDDTAVIVMAMHRALARFTEAERHKFTDAIGRAHDWIVGMQSANGGFAAFDADNEYDYLNQIPFADHGALLDPPTADVTARCVSMLAQLGAQAGHDRSLDRAVAYLVQEQKADGSWYGRWGINYIYGTWSALCALNAAHFEPASGPVRKAVEWLISIQNDDGGWGEDGESYRLDYAGYEAAPSTASQTAWALLGLMAAGAVHHPAVKRGIDYLLRHQGPDGFWTEQRFTATGFPRVFYLRYHGYAKFFPLWSLARYRNLKAANTTSVLAAM